MGQKINPKIFRLGISKNQWSSRFCEKKKEEFSLYNYQNIKIEAYLKQFFYLNGLVIQNTKYFFNGSNLTIYISYISTKLPSIFLPSNTQNSRIKFKAIKDIKNYNLKKRKSRANLVKGKRIKTSHTAKKKLNQLTFFKIKKTKSFEKYLKLKYFSKSILSNSQKIPSKFSNSKFLAKTKQNKLKTSRLCILNRYKLFFQHKEYRTREILKKNVFIEKLLESLSLFLGKNYHIFIAFKNLNRGITLILTKTEQDLLKKKVIALKRFRKDKFFKQGLNPILITIKIKNSAKLLGQFISKQFNILKRHNYFLNFLKLIIKNFISFQTSKVKGIKICISGRFNGAPRAKNQIITVGDIPTQTISKHIDYSETTSYTKNGTFGTKIWVNYD